MSLSPVAFIAPNYRDFKSQWVKFYEPGTTTPKTIYTDSAATISAAKLQLNADGFIVSAGGAIVVPYVAGAYDAYIFDTEAEADANDTTNAVRVADNISSNPSESVNVFDDVDEMKEASLSVGDVVMCKRYYTGGDLVSGLIYEIQANASVDGYIDHELSNGNIAVLSREKVLPAQVAGVVGDNVTSDSATMTEFLNNGDSEKRVPAGKYILDSGVVWDLNALRLSGDGISSYLKGTNAHTLTVSAGQNDGVIEHFWIDQLDSGTATYDAIHLLAGEMHVNFCDVDFADRYGIYCGAARTQIHQYQSQKCDVASIFSFSNAYAISISDVFFENVTTSGSGIIQEAQRCVTTNVSSNSIGGYVLDNIGNYNVYSNMTAVNCGGGIADDAFRFTGQFSTGCGLIAKGTTGVAFHVTGNNNQLDNIIADNSSLQGLLLDAQNCNVSGRIFNSGVGGTENAVDVIDVANTVDLRVSSFTGAYALNVTANDQTIRGYYQGAVNLASSHNTFHGKATSLIVAGQNNKVSVSLAGGTGVGLSVTENSNDLSVTVDNAGTQIAVISSTSNTGRIRGFGASGVGITVSGDDNCLDLRVTGSTGDDLEVTGNTNALQVNIAGDVTVTGDQNCITGVIKGNLTFSATASKNIVLGKVLGTITDNAGDNDTTNTTS